MHFAWIFFLFLSAVYGAPAQMNEIRSLPTAPSDDPFYTAPSGFEKAKLGDVLRSRKVSNPIGIVVIPQKIKAAYQLLVRSEDTFGNPIAVVTTLLVPHNADPNKLLSYQMAEDASYINCSPSYAMQLGANPETIVSTQIEQILVQASLEQGFYTIVPDHEGPKSTFVAAYSAGYAVLNSIRGAKNFANETGLNPDAKVVLWGYSGGSLGSEWGAMLQPSYAPDINLVGSAFGGVIVDIDHMARKNLGTIFAGFVIAAINGLAHEYSEMNDYVKKVIYPSQYDFFKKADSTCETQTLLTYAFVKLEKFTKVGINALNDPVVKKITDQNNAINGINSGLVPKVPIFLYNSKLDEIVPSSDGDDLYKTLCSKGVTVEYRQDLLGGHITQAAIGAGNAFSWLKDRLDGKSPNSGCEKKLSFSNAFNREAFKGLSDVIIGALLAVLSVPVGPFSGFSN